MRDFCTNPANCQAARGHRLLTLLTSRFLPRLLQALQAGHRLRQASASKRCFQTHTSRPRRGFAAVRCIRVARRVARRARWRSCSTRRYVTCSRPGPHCEHCSCSVTQDCAYVCGKCMNSTPTLLRGPALQVSPAPSGQPSNGTLLKLAIEHRRAALKLVQSFALPRGSLLEHSLLSRKVIHKLDVHAAPWQMRFVKRASHARVGSVQNTVALAAPACGPPNIQSSLWTGRSRGRLLPQPSGAPPDASRRPLYVDLLESSQTPEIRWGDHRTQLHRHRPCAAASQCGLHGLRHCMSTVLTPSLLCRPAACRSSHVAHAARPPGAAWAGAHRTDPPPRRVASARAAKSEYICCTRDAARALVSSHFTGTQASAAVDCRCRTAAPAPCFCGILAAWVVLALPRHNGVSW